MRLGSVRQETTAFVTGADLSTGLGSARALRAAGARVVGFAERPGSATCRSRVWSAVHPLSGGAAECMVDEVLARASEVCEPVFLLPTQDDFVEILARRRAELPGNVRTCLPDPAVVEVLLAKTRFSAWASERGYPVPRTVVVESAEQLEAAVAGFRFPAILKPVVRTPGWQRRSPVDKVLFLEGPEALREVPFDLFEAAPAYVLSEWIEGEDSDVRYCLAYLDEDSEMIASFTGRKLLQYPRLTGSTAVCVGGEDAGLAALAARLFKEAGCTGLASLEVKRSAADGRDLITEPTVGRPNLQSSSAYYGGRNLVGIAMRHTMGLDHHDLLGPVRPCVWVHEQAVVRLLLSRACLSLPYGRVLAESWKARRVAGAFFTRSDPRPLTGLASEWLERRLARRDRVSLPSSENEDPTRGSHSTASR